MVNVKMSIERDYEMTTQRQHNAGDLPDCKEIKL